MVILCTFTDSNNQDYADSISQSQCWKVDLASLLSNSHDAAFNYYTGSQIVFLEMKFMDSKIRCFLVTILLSTRKTAF